MSAVARGFPLDRVERMDLLQFGSLMESVDRHTVTDRMALVNDVMVGCNGDGKTLKAHLNALRSAIGLDDPAAETGSQRFNSLFGKSVRKIAGAPPEVVQ